MHDILQKNTPDSIDSEALLREAQDIVGNEAEQISAQHESTIIKLGHTECLSDQPLGFNPFIEDEFQPKLKTATLLPAKMDELPVGVTTITGSEEEWTETGTEMVHVSRLIEVIPTKLGKVIPVEQLGKNYDYWEMQPDLAKLMKSLGFVTSPEEGIIAVPTPETVVRAAALQGVDIRLFPETNAISGADYLATFASGKYPVSLQNYYKHDIEDDHLTAMVLGGKPLRDALKEAALQYTGADQEVIDNAASDIDGLTVLLRAVVGSGFLFGEAYGEERGRKTFHDKASMLGISAETADKIIATAQENARKFKMNVTELE